MSECHGRRQEGSDPGGPEIARMAHMRFDAHAPWAIPSGPGRRALSPGPEPFPSIGWIVVAAGRVRMEARRQGVTAASRR